MLLQPFLCIDSIEVANDARTLAYVNNGLGGSAMFVTPEADGDMSCDAYDDGPYVSPAADGAPWYVSSRPESGEFLGLFLTPELLPVAARTVSVQGPRGAALGPLQLRQRVLSCQGVMCAGSQRGMAWGERWLADALAGDCDLSSAVILPTCPPTDDDEDRYFRTLERVGLVDGPTPTPIQGIPACTMQSVAFQLAAEIPELLVPPTVLATGSMSDGGSLSAEVSVGPWVGDAAVRITIEPTTALANWVVKAVPMALGQTCPAAGADPCLLYRLPALPAAHRLVIDASVREVTELDITAKRWVSGFGRLDFDGIFDWPEFPPCSNNCLSVVAGTGTATVTIEQIDREL